MYKTKHFVNLNAFFGRTLPTSFCFEQASSFCFHGKIEELGGGGGVWDIITTFRFLVRVLVEKNRKRSIESQRPHRGGFSCYCACY